MELMAIELNWPEIVSDWTELLRLRRSEKLSRSEDSCVWLQERDGRADALEGKESPRHLSIIFREPDTACKWVQVTQGEILSMLYTFWWKLP